MSGFTRSVKAKRDVKTELDMDVVRKILDYRSQLAYSAKLRSVMRNVHYGIHSLVPYAILDYVVSDPDDISELDGHLREALSCVNLELRSLAGALGPVDIDRRLRRFNTIEERREIFRSVLHGVLARGLDRVYDFNALGPKRLRHTVSHADDEWNGALAFFVPTRQ